MKLQTKAALLVLLLAALAGQTIARLSADGVRGAVVAAAEREARADLLKAAAAAAPGLRARSEALLLPELTSLARATRSVYGMALDQAGTVVAHTNVSQKGRVLADPFARRALAGRTPLAEQSSFAGRPILDLSVPVWSVPAGADPEEFLFSTRLSMERLGTLRLGVPLEDSLALARAIDRRIRVVGGLGAAAASLILLLFLRGLLAPIRLLALGMTRIRAGDYGGLVPAGSSDELGDLARDFNAMSQDLSRTTVSKDFLNDILRNLQEALLVIVPDGRVTLANPPAARLFARPERELLGTPAAALFEDAAEVLGEEALRRLEAAGISKDVELRVPRANQEPVPVLLSVSTLRGADGRLRGFIATARDLSQIKSLESRMRQTEKLSAVGRLAAGVAHEINNPLGIILGFAQALTQDLSDSDHWAMPLKSIEREALRCKNLVADLLLFSRQAKPKAAPFDLNEPVRKSLSLLAAQANLRAVEVVADLGPAQVVRGDADQLQQVVVNLCGNALDAMPAGGRLTVSTRPRPLAGRTGATLEVADTGTGIPPEALKKIFEPFFTTKEVGKGTGLGLALVHEIVAKHDGTISVRSSPGQGTTFSIVLPSEVSNGMS